MTLIMVCMAPYYNLHFMHLSTCTGKRTVCIHQPVLSACVSVCDGLCSRRIMDLKEIFQ